LLDGPPGTGKTTLAMALAYEMDCEIQIANAANVRTAKKIVPYIMRTRNRAILFIDEIHRLTKLVEEILYPVMEDFRLDIVNNQQTVSFQLDKFTLVGATTEGGSLTAPFRDRFKVHEHLSLYSPTELRRLVDINATKLKLAMDVDSRNEIAAVSRGTPRVTNNLLEWLRDYSLSKKVRQITHGTVMDALKMKGIDSEGLTQVDIKYLTCLRKAFRGGPVSVETLSNATSISRETICHSIEPYLILLGKIAITTKGRIAL
jgi:Holliday junction DNA helicase RuvB